jgi:hypothetical protein
LDVALTGLSAWAVLRSSHVHATPAELPLHVMRHSSTHPQTHTDAYIHAHRIICSDSFMLLLSLDVKTDSVRVTVCQVLLTHLVRL